MQIYSNPFRQLRGEVDRLLNGFLGPTFDGFLPGVVVNVWDKDNRRRPDHRRVCQRRADPAFTQGRSRQIAKNCYQHKVKGYNSEGRGTRY